MTIAVRGDFEYVIRTLSSTANLELFHVNRIGKPSALTSGLLWAGGEGLFRDICPVEGCLAVEFSSTGEVVRSYPYRLGSLVESESIVKYPRGSVHPFQAPAIHQLPHAVRRYSNGDLLVVFNYRNAEPW